MTQGELFVFSSSEDYHAPLRASRASAPFFLTNMCSRTSWIRNNNPLPPGCTLQLAERRNASFSRLSSILGHGSNTAWCNE